MDLTRADRRGIRRAVAVLLAAAGFLSVLTITDVSAQDVESLRARAASIAAELEELQAEEQRLTQDYLVTGEELATAERRISETKAGAADAQARMDQAKAQASQYMVSAYIGAGAGTQVTVGAGDPNEAVNEQVLLDTVWGNRQDVADDLRAARLDLEDQTAELDKATRILEAKRAEQKRIKDQVESGVARQQELLDGANAELQSAIAAEQARRAAEAEARVRAQAEAQAARAAATQSSTGTGAAGSTTSGGRTASAPATTAPRSTPSGGASTRAPVAVAPTPVVSGPNPRASAAIAAAMSQMGVPYRFGGSSPSTGFDCSGLMQWSWRQAGVSISRTTYSLWADTQRVSAQQLQPGDFVFFNGLGHMGMYIGGGQMIHSPRTGKTVEIAPIFRGGFSFMGGGRLR